MRRNEKPDDSAGANRRAKEVRRNKGGRDWHQAFACPAPARQQGHQWCCGKFTSRVDTRRGTRVQVESWVRSGGMSWITAPFASSSGATGRSRARSRWNEAAAAEKGGGDFGRAPGAIAQSRTLRTKSDSADAGDRERVCCGSLVAQPGPSTARSAEPIAPLRMTFLNGWSNITSTFSDTRTDHSPTRGATHREVPPA